MRSLTFDEVQSVSGGNPAIDARADTSSQLLQETPETAGWVGMTGLALTGPAGAALAAGVALVKALSDDFGEKEVDQK